MKIKINAVHILCIHSPQLNPNSYAPTFLSYRQISHTDKKFYRVIQVHLLPKGVELRLIHQ